MGHRTAVAGDDHFFACFHLVQQFAQMGLRLNQRLTVTVIRPATKTVILRGPPSARQWRKVGPDLSTYEGAALPERRAMR